MPETPAIPDYIHQSVRSLPPLPAGVNRLLELARTPDAPFREIAEVISADQTLTARVLRAANSAFYGTSRRVRTIKQATVVLGSDAIINLALSISALNLEGEVERAWPGDLDAYWRHNIAVAILAREMAGNMLMTNAEEVFVAGLLHDIGKLVLLSHFGERYAALLSETSADAPFHVREREALETDHAVAGHALCLHWKLPASLTRAIAHHHDTTPAPADSIGAVVRNANDLVKLMGLGESCNPHVLLRPPQHLPHTSLRRPQLRTLLLDLPPAVHKAAEAFGKAAAAAPDAGDTPAPQRPVVRLHVQAPEAYEVLRPALWAMGFEPLAPHDPSSSSAEDGTALDAAYVTDQPEALASEADGVPALDYAAWRADHGQPLGDGHLDASLLRAWLSEHLAAPAPAV